MIGILALQGAFSEHVNVLARLKVPTLLVKTPQDLNHPELKGLILPGGESTTMALIAERNGMLEPLKNWIKSRPTWGICAGLILMSREALGSKKGGQTLLGGLDIVVHRNAFGHQKDSFVTSLQVLDGTFPGVFIRAPLITTVGSQVQVLAQIPQGIVAVRQGHLLGTAFHPELTQDPSFHRYFLDMCQ